jgi:hypothetical protein
MTTSSPAIETALAKSARVTPRALIVELQDGRTLSVPLQWYPRLAHGSPSERQQWELIGPGVGIHWPALDEDISVDGLLQGLPSGESEESFRRWLNTRPRQANRRLQRAKARRKPTGTGAVGKRLRG